MADNTFGQGTPGDEAFPDPATLTYEQARDELIETVKILELGQMSLDESLKYWERGEALAKRCEVLLDGAQQRVEAALGSTKAEAAADASEED
ncbi:Exodeoxyribonuclease VII small subunit [Corynebacterium appendicis CIP 107643]|uniref:Exodeoxyribonuclease 7 small subunit n=1 Tax=Corynebacterium appendicis CIP 107643 TaxID=1161099 RepID=A0A1N7JUT5_9CORY|nr:exodeoxyribonuclease VII small subunit [Corynebacterium appendicis]MCT1684253.1 exodeoxyribonuclease VII small subunit [Corynebacterium appendicis]WJY60726.1 exodeoxyribonuclease VII small subunit [Corynebacterium appendicis CIP 107643]SIS53097.1 Exodeoxyribonuclease VII small subunit [Corynebacterium appendicis CIP 107643]